MIRSVRCLMRWCLSVKRLDEGWVRRWSCCVSRLKHPHLRHHRLRKCGLKLNTLWLEWKNVKLGFSLLKTSLRVYSIFHLLYLDLLLYFGIHLSLSPGLCWWSLYSPNPRTIGGLLKFHSPQRLFTICIINVGDLKICLFAQINPDILEHSSEKAVIGEYAGHALTTWDHVHHHQIPQVNPSPHQIKVHDECLIIGDLVSVSASW